MNVPFSIILAIDKNNGIGKNNTLPWHIREDLRNFSKITNNNTIIMGRKTWDSLPKKPLPRRTNIVVSRSIAPHNLPQGVLWINDIVSPDFQNYLSKLVQQKQEIFCIGGVGLLNEFSKYKNMCNKLYIHYLNHNYQCDVTFPIQDWINNMKTLRSINKEVKDTINNIKIGYNQTIYYKPT